MKIYTADNLTNEEIVALGDDQDSSLQTRAWCCQAMYLTRGSKKAEAQRVRARTRVAEVLNARSGL